MNYSLLAVSCMGPLWHHKGPITRAGRVGAVIVEQDHLLVWLQDTRPLLFCDH